MLAATSPQLVADAIRRQLTPRSPIQDATVQCIQHSPYTFPESHHQQLPAAIAARAAAALKEVRAFVRPPMPEPIGSFAESATVTLLALNMRALTQHLHACTKDNGQEAGTRFEMRHRPSKKHRWTWL